VGQQGSLEVEEEGLGMIVPAGVNGLIQTLRQLAAEVIERVWTRVGLLVRVKEAHGVDSWLVLRDGKQQPG
jgi:hypothetical protein